MARLPRIVIPGYPLHVIQRGNDRQPVFFAEEDYCKYLETLRQGAEATYCHIHAYVLMTNHVHLLVTPSGQENVSLMMQSLGRQYVSYVNRLYQRSGTLWEGRFKSALIDSEQYLLTCSRYIELNPVRAGMVKGPGEYRWSSYRANGLGRKDNVISPHQLYQSLGATTSQRRKTYRELFRVHLDADALQLIRESTQQNTIIGNCRFQEEIQAMLKRRVMKHNHGGDRKSESFRQISSDLTP